ncbi:WD repeat-containing protein 38-like [Phymastichus coffea]|uniref:WD repeat-containing protein 38-like n=1 Tax=Phymastichus coffea TaxID=108790 RepID=UPI00273B441D|nr:WD repeat-containing protein 38-like [Phymastichus coffea]XP_058793005.1 WD repeat-containing protein 38-like [Phymastichus coffea]
MEKSREKLQYNMNEIEKGFLVERKLSREDIIERYEWIKTKRSKVNSINEDRNYLTRKVYFPDTFNGLYCARYSSDGETVVTGYGSGCIQLRNGDTGELRNSLKAALETSFPVTSCCFHPINRNIIYASSACGSIFLCKMNTVEFYNFSTELDNEINAVDVNISGEYVITGGKDAGLRVYDSETGKLIKNYTKDKINLIAEDATKFHHMRIFAVKCHRIDSNIVVTGGWDAIVKVWDLRVGGGSIKAINGPYICGNAIDLRDTNILTGSWVVKNSLQIWDISSGKLIETVNPINRETTLDGEYLYVAQYFDGDPYGEHVVVGGSGIGFVEVINLKEKNVVARFKVNKAVLTIDSYKTNIVYGGMDSTINLTEYF